MKGAHWMLSHAQKEFGWSADDHRMVCDLTYDVAIWPKWLIEPSVHLTMTTVMLNMCNVLTLLVTVWLRLHPSCFYIMVFGCPS